MAFGGSVDMFAYVLMVKVGLENKCLVNKIKNQYELHVGSDIYRT